MRTNSGQPPDAPSSTSCLEDCKQRLPILAPLGNTLFLDVIGMKGENWWTWYSESKKERIPVKYDHYCWQWNLTLKDGEECDDGSGLLDAAVHICELVMFGPGNQLAELDAYSANDSASQAAFLTGATRKYGAKAGNYLGKPWKTGSKVMVSMVFKIFLVLLTQIRRV